MNAKCKPQTLSGPSFTPLHITFIIYHLFDVKTAIHVKGFCIRALSPHFWGNFRAAAWGGHISNLPRLRIVRMKEKAEISRLCWGGGDGSEDMREPFHRLSSTSPLAI